MTKPSTLEPYLRERGTAPPPLAAKNVVASAERSRSVAPDGGEPKPAAAATPPPIANDQAQDSARYAQREQQAPALQSFQGGDAVVITMSTLVAVLLVVLLIVLLVD